jgi:hypothetical protein
VLISVAAAAACTVLAANLFDSRGVQGVLLIGAGTPVAVMVVASALMPTIDEIGDFPGDVLWDFRLASLFTLTALWATVTIVLTALIRRLHADHVKVRARGEPVRSARVTSVRMPPHYDRARGPVGARGIVVTVTELRRPREARN